MFKKYSLQIILLLCLGIFVFLYFFNPIETEDIWWHLSTGQWILEHGQIPHVDIFPFTNERIPWFCNNEWLGSVVLFLTVKMGGLLGLKVFRALFFVGIISILLFYSYKRLPFSLLLFLILMVTFGLTNRSFLRPDLFNFLFIQIFLINLFKYEQTGDRHRLWVLPFLNIIWLNIHLGSFVYGALLLIIFFISACMRYFNWGGAAIGERARGLGQIKDLALTALTFLASYFVNPYGIEGFLYPFKVFLLPNFVGYYKLSAVIGEMQPPGYLFVSWGYFYYFVLFVLALWVIIFNKKNNFTLTILLFFALFAFFYMQRNSSFFTLACAYIIVEGAGHLGFKDAWQQLRYGKAFNGILIIVVALYLLAQIADLWNKESYIDGHWVSDRSIMANPVTEAPIQLLIKNKITGPIFDQDVLGGQIIWFGYPALRPFIDSRNSSKERFNNAMAIFLNPAVVWPKAERDYHLRIVMLNADSGLDLPFIKYLNAQASWQLIAINGPIVTYVKRGAYSLPKELNGLEMALKAHRVSHENMRILQSLAGGNNNPVGHGVIHPTVSFIDLYSTSLTLFKLGYTAAAAEDLVKASRISDQPYMRQTAGQVLKQLVLSPVQ